VYKDKVSRISFIYIYIFFFSERTNHIEKAKKPNHHILLVYGNYFILFRFIILRFTFSFSLFLLTILERNKKKRARTYFILLSTKKIIFVYMVCVKKKLHFYFFVYKYMSILVYHNKSLSNWKCVKWFFLLLDSCFYSFSFFSPRLKRMTT